MVRIGESNTETGVSGGGISGRDCRALARCLVGRCLRTGGPRSRSGSLGGRRRRPH
jgi:hypothetical protein